LAGQPACLAIKPSKANETLTRDELRKGMVLIDPSLKMDPTWNFEAEVVILHHSTTIKEGYQCVMHCGIVRQSIEIMEIEKEDKILRTGDKGLCKMKFLFNPEFLTKGQVLILREGRTKILGVITNILPDDVVINHVLSENKKNEEKNVVENNGNEEEKKKEEVEKGENENKNENLKENKQESEKKPKKKNKDYKDKEKMKKVETEEEKKC